MHFPVQCHKESEGMSLQKVVYIVPAERVLADALSFPEVELR